MNSVSILLASYDAVGMPSKRTEATMIGWRGGGYFYLGNYTVKHNFFLRLFIHLGKQICRQVFYNSIDMSETSQGYDLYKPVIETKFILLSYLQ